MKRSHKVYVLVALIGIAGVSLARYISSLRDVEAPKPAAKYADKKSEVQIESVTPAKAEPDQLVSEYKPQMRSEKAEQRESQPQEVSLRPTRPEDRRLRVEESRRQLPPDKQEAEPPPKRQLEAFLPAEGFEKGKALDDEFEEMRAFGAGGRAIGGALKSGVKTLFSTGREETPPGLPQELFQRLTSLNR